MADKRTLVLTNAASGAPLRSIDFTKVQSVVIQVASSKRRHFLMVRVPKEYDLVLSTLDGYLRRSFRDRGTQRSPSRLLHRFLFPSSGTVARARLLRDAR
ncbi:hypothetical protein MTO96_028389 [Rhipicephalus appendiculatus]